jgi:hypothetical protein
MSCLPLLSYVESEAATTGQCSAVPGAIFFPNLISFHVVCSTLGTWRKACSAVDTGGAKVMIGW